MKFFVSLLLIALLSFAACLYLPWWSIAVVSFLVVALLPQSPFKAFLCGFLAIGLLWGVLSFLKSSQNEHVLAHKVSLVILKTDSPAFLIIATAFLGALVAGLAALTASFLRKKQLKPAN